MKRILFFIGYIWSYIYNYNMALRFRFVKSYIYTGWISRQFNIMNGFANYPIGVGGGQYISVGRGSILGANTLLQAWDSYHGQKFSPKIIIGENTRLGTDCHITAIGTIKIGNGVQTGRGVLISDNSHGVTNGSDCKLIPVEERPLVSKGDILIGDNVWIGDNVVILSGVTIGDGAIIGANAVVTKNVEKFTTVAGVPARKI
ncbi:MAG: acyltransferase [Bacteroidales bacterium]|nr:acyltransferase [Bacteroidales bacterium]